MDRVTLCYLSFSSLSSPESELSEFSGSESAPCSQLIGIIGINRNCLYRPWLMWFLQTKFLLIQSCCQRCHVDSLKKWWRVFSGILAELICYADAVDYIKKLLLFNRLFVFVDNFGVMGINFCSNFNIANFAIAYKDFL